MKYNCPICNCKLFKINNKLVCTNEKCSFQCSINEYYLKGLPWNIQKCKDNSIWENDAFDLYPYFISKEYKRLYDLIKKNKLYGALFQIKDIFEILLKLPIIIIVNKCYINNNRGDKEEEIIYKLFSKKLSLGDWLKIAKLCLKLNHKNEIMYILKDIDKIYTENNIINRL